MKGYKMIRDILIIQKRELEQKQKERFIERQVDYTTPMKNDLVKVIIGPRRAGKSSLAFNMLASLGEEFGYVNFDDERLVGIKNYDDIINAIASIYDNPKFILFDEIQNLTKWELFVNRLQRQGYNLVITGSNSNLLSKELASHLTGRHILINILPFSFAEFLTAGTEHLILTESEKRAKLSDYIYCGGYPEPLFKQLDEKEYLATLYNSIIYKDIISRFKIRIVPAIENLAGYLLSNTGREFSYNTLCKISGCGSVHTVDKYLQYLEESFLFFKIHRFSPNFEGQLSSNKKVYCIDNGFIQSRSFKTEDYISTLYENVVAVKLKKDEMNGGAKVFYWKHPLQQEVDFVLKDGVEVKKLIQVCWNIEDVQKREKKEKSLMKAGNQVKCDNLFVLNDNYEGEEEFTWFGVTRTIKYVPLWKWLLE
jgi:predicted AAA+ superfamily ATPase